MTVSYEEFLTQAQSLAAASSQLGDGWELNHVRTTDGPEETAYLVKRETRTVHFDAHVHPRDFNGVEVPREHDETEENVGDDDPAAWSPCENEKDFPEIPEPETVHFEYHVIHSQFYQVPVLYFSASYSSGQSLPLEVVWKLLSPVHSCREKPEWGLVTQQEHPLLFRPYYFIHPCHTSDVMATALQSGEETRDMTCREAMEKDMDRDGGKKMCRETSDDVGSVEEKRTNEGTSKRGNEDKATVMQRHTDEERGKREISDTLTQKGGKKIADDGHVKLNSRHIDEESGKREIKQPWGMNNGAGQEGRVVAATHTVDVGESGLGAQDRIEGGEMRAPMANSGHDKLGTMYPSNYLLCWLSMFGPVIGLVVPLAYLHLITSS